MKRLVDVLLAGSGLLLASPLLLLVAVWVKLDSPGPVLFRQTRVGRDGCLFQIHKFRTMRHLASGSAVTVGADSRITRSGRWLRRTKLDEAPQLLDVLSGHMSIVGPRPEVPMYVEIWPEEQRRLILSVRPGITDPAAIRFRNESEILATATDPEVYYREVVIPEKLAMYEEYVRSRTIWGDLRLIMRTCYAVLGRESTFQEGKRRDDH